VMELDLLTRCGKGIPVGAELGQPGAASAGTKRESCHVVKRSSVKRVDPAVRRTAR
jgi:hypothetical protein